MFFALIQAIKEVMEGVNKIAEMNVLILKNGFELQLHPEDSPEQFETDNTGKITGNSQLGSDGVLRINLPENYFNAEFKEKGENN